MNSSSYPSDVGRLSLATFDPSSSLNYPPYLNTPRSIEACRLNGVQPIELLEVPLEEFRKDFPGDADAARRRYDKIEGARKRVLASVISTWKELCENDWLPVEEKIAMREKGKETIITVPPEAHSTLLEIQAEQFRKVESSQWKALQTSLGRQVRKACDEVRNRGIMSKHEEIQSKNDEQRKIRMEQKRKAELDAVELAQRKHLDLQRQLKQNQEEEFRAAQKRVDDERAREKRERQLQEEKERLRVQREENMKRRRANQQRILDGLIEENRRAQETRDLVAGSRQKAESLERAQERARQQKKHMDKIQKARDEVAASEERKRVEYLRKEAQDAERRRQQREAFDNIQKQRREASEERERQVKDRVHQVTVEGSIARSHKLMYEMAFKEALSEQELTKVREEQERRRNIKAIRQEAYDLSATRRKKVEEHRLNQLLQSIKMKEDRSNAIKEGKTVLARMRLHMSEAMLATTTEMNEELRRLQESKDFTTEKAINKMVEVSEKVLLPSLQRRFGTVRRIATAPAAGQGSGALFRPTSGEINNANTPTNQISAERPKTSFSGLIVDPSTTRDDLIFPHQPNCTSGVKTLSGSRSLVDAVAEPHGQARGCALQRSKSSLAVIAPTTDVIFATLQRAQGVHSARGGEGLPGLGKSEDGTTEKEGNNDTKRFQFSSTTTSSSMQNISAEISRSSAAPAHAVHRSSSSPHFLSRPNTAGTHDVVLKHRNFNPAHSSSASRNKDTVSNFVTGGKFRREYSADHPLAGGTGKYKRERAMGLRPAGGEFVTATNGDSSASILSESPQYQDRQRSSPSPTKASILAHNKNVDRSQKIELLRRRQNEALLRVLEEEKEIEEGRVRASRAAGPAERVKLELIFAEERRRASDRIVSLTKSHEDNIRAAMLAVANLRDG